MAQDLFAHSESSVHAASNIPEKPCCCQGFSHCRHGSEKILSILVRNLLLPVPSWKVTLLCCIPNVKVNMRPSLEEGPDLPCQTGGVEQLHEAFFIVLL